MHINIQGRHLAVTPALNDYVKEKIKKIKFYFDHIVHAHVVLEVVKNLQNAEATITVEHHHFHNKVGTDDMYKSIDSLFDKIEVQVRQYKEYLHDNKTHRNKSSLDERNLEEIENLEEEHKVKVADYVIDGKPRSDLEAVLQLHVETKIKYLGYYHSEKRINPTFIIRGDNDHNSLIEFDGHWEIKSAGLDVKKELLIHSVESFKVPTELIEHAVDYLKNNPSINERIFRSVRAGTVMLLYRKSAEEFGLIR